MAAIVIKSLKGAPSKSQLYSDLHLDISFNYTQNPQLQKEQEIKDINADFDINAIRNSLFNIFTTIPGEKVLNPLFGLNLQQYLFSPISESVANSIGKTILAGITTWEPRIKIININIDTDIDNKQYTITLIFSIPAFSNQKINLTGVLGNSQFYFK